MMLENHRRTAGGYDMCRLVTLLLVVFLSVSAFAALADDATDCATATFDNAIAACSRQIASGTLKRQDRAQAFNNRGAAYNFKGDYDRAIVDLNEAIQFDPKNASAFVNRGDAYNSKGDYDLAIADYSEAIRLGPKNAVAFINRGLAYNSKGDYDRAIADLNEAIRLDPKNKFYVSLKNLAKAAKPMAERADERAAARAR
jgi:tetratricopeptide (TPR) repeat protein